MVNQERMNMKFLVGYDRSNQSEDALELAKKHALAFDAKVYVVTSLHGEDQTTLEEVEKAKQGLKHAKTVLSESGIDVETHLLVRGLTPGPDLVQLPRNTALIRSLSGSRRSRQSAS
jgi:nucleotide-binding universal stress UspA family protein